MLLDIDPPFAHGDVVELELTFERHEPISIEAELGPPAEGGASGNMTGGMQTPMHGGGGMAGADGSATPMR
jgi:hypothetical protein